MSAIDRTVPPDDVEVRLRSWMAVQGPEADLTGAYDTIVDATRGGRQRPWFLVRRGIAPTTPPSRVSRRVGLVALALLLLGAVIAGGLLAGGRILPADPDQPAPSSFPVRSLPALIEPGAAIEGQGRLVTGTLYTSRRFEPSVTFHLTARNEGQPEGDVCPPVDTSPRTIVLQHPKSCFDELRFIRPWAVDCGVAGSHPDADTLATAMLAIPATTSVKDLGDLQADGALPAGQFADAYHGRVIEMLGYAPLFRADLPDRDHCRLLPEPGTNDPIIEIRRDLSALFVLVDVGGELVVIRASGSGHDAPSGAEAQSRGYGQAGSDELRHLLGLVNDIRFGNEPTP